MGEAEALAALSRRLLATATEIRLAAASLDRGLAGVGWSGPVASRFREAAAGVSARARAAAGEVEGIAAALARQQRALDDRVRELAVAATAVEHGVIGGVEHAAAAVWDALGRWP